MDISSTTSSVSTSQNTTTATTSTKTTDSETSFKTEMDKVSDETKATEQNTSSAKGEEPSGNTKTTEDSTGKKPQTQQTATLVQDKNMDFQDLSKNGYILAGEVGFNEFQQNIGDIVQNNTINVQDVLLSANKQLEDIAIKAEVPSKVDYTNIEMTYEDASFFADLVQNTDKTLQNVVTELQNNTVTEKVAQHVKVSATLMTALSEAVKNNQPFRIDFDKDISVIIRVDREGSLSATFIPGDRAVEQYLKQNISLLQQRFDDQELAYNELTYTKQQRNRQQQERRNNKENE